MLLKSGSLGCLFLYPKANSYLLASTGAFAVKLRSQPRRVSENWAAKVQEKSVSQLTIASLFLRFGLKFGG